MIRRTVKREFVNLLGWHTKKKLLVFESDDWGGIRMPSSEAFNKLRTHGVSVNDDPFSKYDSLASNNDLENLFEVLTSIRDSKGSHPVFTANCVVANPDFTKIKQEGFKKYYYELFIETLNKYPKHQKSFELWKEGIAQKIFFPQYHSREHVNTIQWLTLLNNGSEDFRYAFSLGTYAININGVFSKRKNLMATLDYENDNEKETILQSLIDGLLIFHSIFGYSSTSFTPPCSVWNNTTEELLAKNGVRFIKTRSECKIIYCWARRITEGNITILAKQINLVKFILSETLFLSLH